jgi:hypothetical protein
LFIYGQAKFVIQLFYLAAQRNRLGELSRRAVRLKRADDGLVSSNGSPISK